MLLVSIELQKHEHKFGRRRNAVGTQVNRLVFLQHFGVLLHFDKRFFNSIKTGKTCFLFLLENSVTKKRKQLIYFDHQNVRSLCSCHHYVNSSSVWVLCLHEETRFLTNQCTNFLSYLLKTYNKNCTRLTGNWQNWKNKPCAEQEPRPPTAMRLRYQCTPKWQPRVVVASRPHVS